MLGISLSGFHGSSQGSSSRRKVKADFRQNGIEAAHFGAMEGEPLRDAEAPLSRRLETSKTTNKFSPEVRARAVRMVLVHMSEHPSRWTARRRLRVVYGD